jgi:hypothetical protein
MVALTAESMLRAELTQANLTIRRLQDALNTCSEQRRNAQVTAAYVMRKHGETALVIPQADAMDIVKTARLRTEFRGATPEGAQEQVPVMAVELLATESAKAGAPAAPVDGARPLLRLAT